MSTESIPQQPEKTTPYKEGESQQHYSRDELMKKHVPELKKILQEKNIHFEDLHEKEELVDLILTGHKKDVKLGIPHQGYDSKINK